MPLVLEIKVIPSSGRQQCLFDRSGIIKCFLKSAPEKGRANAELVKFLSKKLRLPQEKIIILQGALSRKKRIKIDAEMTIEGFCEKMGVHYQKSLIS